MNNPDDRHDHPVYDSLSVFKRGESKFYYAETSFVGKQLRKSLKTDRLNTALTLAGEWFKALHRAEAKEDQKKRQFDRLSQDPLLGDLFASWRTTLTPARRAYHDTKWGAVGPFWRTIRVAEVTPQLVREFYQQRRRTKTQYGKAPSNSTLYKDIILVRLILGHAIEEKHLDRMPIIPDPGTIVDNPRPWLTEREWTRLCAESEKRIDKAADNPRLQQQRVDLDDQMRWMVASMMRVDEMLGVRFRDCREEKNKAKQSILVCEVDGKHGPRTVIARRVAARIYADRWKNSTQDPEALIFPVHHRDAITGLLKAAQLHVDPRSGFTRNFKSLRATSISFEVLRGAPSPNLLMIARNAGTSVAMIDQFYARRLSAEMGKDSLTSKQNDEY